MLAVRRPLLLPASWALATLAACTPADPCAAPGTMCVVAGVPGMGGADADGHPADGTRISYPVDVAVAADGGVLFVEWGNHRVRRIEADGTLSTVAGTGLSGDGPEGPAAAFALHGPAHLAFDPADPTGVVIAAWHNHRLVRAQLDAGQASVLGGVGEPTFGGDGGPVTEAGFDGPASVAFDDDGALYVADQLNHVVRRVDARGVVTTIAGQAPEPVASVAAGCEGTCFERHPGWSGDGGPALEARLGAPEPGLDPYPALRLHHANGRLLLADARNHVVRTIDLATGLIEHLAGIGGVAEVGADGGLAASTALNGPSDVATGPDGSVYVADAYNHCVRRVLADGTMSTVAGVCGQPGGRGEAVTDASGLLYEPYGIDLSPDGSRLYIADKGNDVVRALTLPVDGAARIR